MHFERHITRIFSDEHRETLAAMEALDGFLAGLRRGAVIDPSDGRTKSVFAQLQNSLGATIRDHFGFEEEALFPRLIAFGDHAIAAHLTDEHRIILPLADEIAGMIAAADGGFTVESTDRFREVAAALVEHMMMHIQKEEMGLLPLLDDILDEDADFELAQRHGD